MYVIFPLQISTQSQQAHICRFAFHLEFAVGTLIIAITGTLLKTITLISGSQNFQSNSIEWSKIIFLSKIALSLEPESE